MIDLGPIPKAIFIGVNDECSLLEANIIDVAQNFWPDRASGKYLLAWEKMLDIIVDSGATVDMRRSVVLSRLNAVGGMSREAFYYLAERLTWKKVLGEIEFLDGKTLSFRVGISAAGPIGVGDTVYDNRLWGSTTCICRYKSKGAALDAALRALVGRAQNYGTVVFFEVIP